MQSRFTPLGSTGIDVFPLCLGGNVFGWTADEEMSFRILDEYVDAGGNFLDTSDGYSRWVPGHTGGESETVIGAWLASRGNRERIILGTKVFGHPEYPGLGSANIKAACEASLRRLRTDYLDVYYAHHDDPDIPMEETLSAFTDLIREGKVRVIGASNFSPVRLAEARSVSTRDGLAAYGISQDHYNLMERDYENHLRGVLEEHGMTEAPYYALASGFLTGKYRPGQDADSARGGASGRWLKGHCSDYLDGRGQRVLGVLDEVAASHGCAVSTVALSWLKAQPTVGSVIASARKPEQLRDLVAAARVDLSAAELEALDLASRGEGHRVSPLG